MHDQADQLRMLVREAVARHGELAPGAPIIAVSGAAPGLGATTLACRLARELTRLGKHIVLIDADLAEPSVADKFNTRPSGTLADVLTGARRAVEVLAPADDGVRVVAGACETAPLDAAALDRLAGEVAALARQADAILIDAGSGMNPWIDRLWQLAQQVLLVAQPESQALMGAYAAVKLAQHDRLAGKLRLAVARCDDLADAERVHAAFAAACARFLDCAMSIGPVALPRFEGASDDEAYRRAVRLLAADLACDFRPLVAKVAGARGRSSRLPAVEANASYPFSPRSVTGG
jgi:flagellar biosynthesis protein FlhG